MQAAAFVKAREQGPFRQKRGSGVISPLPREEPNLRQINYCFSADGLATVMVPPRIIGVVLFFSP
jgi:hypothetical protein